eukprot:scaffold23365_cov115-Isochrysis_galbana.AAC.14
MVVCFPVTGVPWSIPMSVLLPMFLRLPACWPACLDARFFGNGVLGGRGLCRGSVAAKLPSHAAAVVPRTYY